MKKILVALVHSLVVIILTIITQVGGVAYLSALLIGHFWKKDFKGKAGLLFLGMYAVFTLVLVPLLAPFFGREKVRHTEGISPATYATVLLNRNYVRPALNDVLAEAHGHLKGTGIHLRYLDANFPFFDGFPLLPHLSHDDGRKIDIALVYEDAEGRLSPKQKSISGYGVFALPRGGEQDQAHACRSRGYWQYGLTKYMTFGRMNRDLEFSRKGTKTLINAILRSQNIKKIFLEPHLKSRLGIKDGRVRYHGCHAVRHDDHIHLELR
jgi:hypothetical protein